jgi:HSP20 family protein
MSSRYPKRNSRKDDDDYDFFGNAFGFGFQGVDEMIDSMYKSMQTLGSSTSSNAIYYGYQVNIGPDGKPRVREFGNVKPTRRGTFQLASRDPFVDTVLDEKDNALKVVAEMPGIQKEDIKLEAREDSLTIRAQSKDRNYDTTVPLESAVDPKSAKASYRNGILEVNLKLKEPFKPKGIDVKVD